MSRTRRVVLAVAAATLVAPGVISDVPQPDPLQWHTCRPELAYVEFAKDFEVRCDKPWTYSFSGTPPGQVAYSVDHFAIPTSKADWVAQAMATVHTAQVMSGKVKIRFQFASSENPSGCGTDNCRAMVGIGVSR